MRIIILNPVQIVGILFIFFMVSNFAEFWIKKKKPVETLIIVCTPTRKQITRLADLTRLSQTLMHVKNLHWIVVEDGNEISTVVEKMLKRSKIKYSYLYEPTTPEYEKRKNGWAQRNKALKYIRRKYKSYLKNAVIYFADDDNTYDLRLFNNYIRNVKSVGMWAVGLVGLAQVEAPIVKKGKIKGFNVFWGKGRKFATDMAGFAVNLKLILNSTATFHHSCKVFVSEDCFLRQLNISLNEIQPFGFQFPKEILVWHTKTLHSGGNGGDHGYTVTA